VIIIIVIVIIIAILTPYFLLRFSTTKMAVILLCILRVFVYPLSKFESFRPLTSVISQGLALQQGASWLQTTSANLWTFSVNISPLMIHFLCIVLLRYIINLSHVLFYCLILNFSPVVVLVLALIYILLCTLSVLACYRPFAIGKHLNKGIELNYL
jgi:hypothetical protein